MINQAKKGFGWLFLVKVLSRIIDLILNILVLRDLDPKTYGLTTNLGLITNFTLFYLKQVLKQVYQRVTDCQLQSAINMVFFQILFLNFKMYIGLGITIIISPFIWYLSLYGQDDQFIFPAFLFSLSAIIEGASEPYLVQLIQEMKYQKIAIGESIAVFIKTVSLYLLIQNPLMAFGYAQLIFSTIQYLYFSRKQNIEFKKIQNKYYIQPEMKQIGYQFSLMSFMKFLLQELEKIFMVLYNNPAISGEFTLVSHIGAYVPRFIYAPLEEVSFNLFPKLNKESQREYLINTIKILNIIGISFVFAGIPNCSTLLQIYGSQWLTSTCILALQLYCIYEWLMGINGITEAFLNSTIQVKEMNFYRYFLVFQTIIYCLLLLVLIEFGSSGIILSNIISMLLRIAFSIYFIFRFDKEINLFQTLPKLSILYVIGLIPVYNLSGIYRFLFSGFYFGLLGLYNLYVNRKYFKL